MDPSNERTLLLVASHYHNADEVRAFVTHAFDIPLPAGWNLSIVISDNSSSWNGPDPHPRATIVRPRRNLGYLGGCAYAFDWWCTVYGGPPPWLGVVNTDLEFDHDAFTTLLGGVLPEPLGVVAPAVRLPDGTHQNPYLLQRPRAAHILLMRAIYRAPWLTWIWTQAHHVARHVRPRSRATAVRRRERIYAPHGSAMFIRRRFFDCGGTLQFGSFMFGEEVHIAEQARRAGLTVLYEPACRVLHKANAVLGKLPSSMNRAWRAESVDYLWSQYFGPFPRRDDARPRAGSVRAMEG